MSFAVLRGGGHWGQRGKSSKNAVSRGTRHDNKIYRREILLSLHRLLDVSSGAAAAGAGS